MWRDAVDIAWSGKACAVGSISRNITTPRGGSGGYPTSGAAQGHFASYFAILVMAAAAAIGLM